MASVKWLTRLIVTDTPFQGHFQSVDYAYWERKNGLPIRTPLSEIQVKAAIARPAMREVVAAKVQVQGLHCRNAFDQGNPHLGERLPSFGVAREQNPRTLIG